MKNGKLYNSNTSGHKGVYYSKREKKWKAAIRSNNVRYHLGTFNTREEAIKAREKAEIELHKEYSRAKENLFNGTRQGSGGIAV